VSYVLDASVALSWCFADERTPETQALLARALVESVAVPSHWSLELANILTMAERRGRIDPDRISRFVAMLDTIAIVVDATTHERGLSEILNLARREGITSYDAAYLDLALRERLPLATRDAALAEAARRVGVSVIAA
jgi:predicted nucleic acid-binding protein